MSTPIYTDKDYLDEQFRILNEKFVAFEKRMDSHDTWHRTWAKRAISLASVVLAAIGIAWPKP